MKLQCTVGSHLSELHLSEVLFYLSEHFSYPNTLWGVPAQIRDFSIMSLIQHYNITLTLQNLLPVFHTCVADSVVVSVGQVVGEEEVEMMGTGGADELAQLNPSGHV